jgi:hypothetical protein
MQSTRFERHWQILKPEIVKHWDRLSVYDLAHVDGNFDRLVKVIRQCYSPSRSMLSIEAEIRDWIVKRFDEIEKGGDFSPPL